MATPRLKTFLVTFTETTDYRVRVRAADADTALEKAQDLFDRVGPEPSQGFDIDCGVEGGTDDWEAAPANP